MKEALKKVSKKVYILAASLLVVLIVVVVIVVANRPYTVLFTELSATETSSIVSFLEGQGVTDYKIENNDTVLVRKDQAASLTARLLMEGYPQTGFSYSYDTYYNNIGSLSTESERRTAWLHDLQDQMSAVVRCFENVKNATVNISLGEDTSYVLDRDSTVKASASVLVEMNGAARLTKDQATAIRRYIANAVQGLAFDNVTIEDTMGNRYGSSDSLADADASELKIQLEEEWENKIRTTVLQVLTPFYGADNVSVGVNCVVDVSNRTVNTRDVFLPSWADDGSTNGKGIIGSQIYEYFATRGDDTAIGGLVGSETNSDIPEYVEDEADPNGTELELGGSGQTDYDNPYEESVAIYTAGYLTDCSISVSINSKEAGNVDVQQVREHVARAAGIQGPIDEETGEEILSDKISVISKPFYEPPLILPPTYQLPFEEWVIYAAGAGLLVFLLLLIIILSVRKKRKKKKQEQARQRELDELLAAAGLAQNAVPVTGADVMSLQTEKSMELRKDIRQFADDNPEIAAQMIRGWLRGGDENG